MPDQPDGITRVYPRVCGGTIAVSALDNAVQGLSPRVRGNRIVGQKGRCAGRSIPACAGEPTAALPSAKASRVYPRVCGGTAYRPPPTAPACGLSPRVRGNPAAAMDADAHHRSIPACAGEPVRPQVRPRPTAVYPRVCGGTLGRSDRPAERGGLSPRVRGNHQTIHQRHPHRRSIPACAGEPPICRPKPSFRWVYPRVCGGTMAGFGQPMMNRGLSPRVRGNPHPTRAPAGQPRSIPACAGEPAGQHHCPPAGGVYPRVCGGTASHSACARRSSGLSPRVRGNRPSSGCWTIAEGSIPACAGEPCRRRRAGHRQRVYPRVCGGTPSFSFTPGHWSGLSPRVRGNRPHPLLVFAGAGSIPACAGEPYDDDHHRHQSQVYPRVCGGTSCANEDDHPQGGLSPRVRGNRSSAGHLSLDSRSIPACAGEPPRCRGR